MCQNPDLNFYLDISVSVVGGPGGGLAGAEYGATG